MGLFPEKLHKIGVNGFHRLLMYVFLYLKSTALLSDFIHCNNYSTFFLYINDMSADVKARLRTYVLYYYIRESSK